ncbi:MAG: hypothetical protein ACREOQ_02060 [Gemmatimonadales bacterium]
MTRASSLYALVAVCALAGCSKSGPETGAAPAAAPAKDSTMATDKAMKDTTGMAMDSSKMKMDSTKTTMDSTKMMPDTTSMMKDTTMQMPADSAKK